jgi:hypothetical protein
MDKGKPTADPETLRFVAPDRQCHSGALLVFLASRIEIDRRASQRVKRQDLLNGPGHAAAAPLKQAVETGC